MAGLFEMRLWRYLWDAIDDPSGHGTIHLESGTSGHEGDLPRLASRRWPCRMARPTRRFSITTA